MAVDTATEAPAEDTGLALPPIPEDNPETDAVDDAPETVAEQQTETSDPEEEVDLDSLIEEYPTLKEQLDKKLKWERSKADESNRQKRENEVAQARRAAEQEALQAQYQKDLTEAEATYGTWGVDALGTLIDHIEKNGKQDIDLKKYLSGVAGRMLEANRATTVQALTSTRDHIFAELYPGASLSDEVVGEWTKATYSKDVAAQNRAFARAIAEAERTKVMAELDGKSKAEAEKTAKVEEEAAKLQEVDQERRSKPRPTVSLPVGKRKPVSPADLDAIPMNEWLAKPKAERDEMIAAAEEWRRRNANR